MALNNIMAVKATGVIRELKQLKKKLSYFFMPGKSYLTTTGFIREVGYLVSLLFCCLFPFATNSCNIVLFKSLCCLILELTYA